LKWSPTFKSVKVISGPEKFDMFAAKDFFNSIGLEADSAGSEFGTAM
jgi:hypothetical protein